MTHSAIEMMAPGEKPIEGEGDAWYVVSVDGKRMITHVHGFVQGEAQLEQMVLNTALGGTEVEFIARIYPERF